ncbi:(2Fe-2S)-binding protein [Ectobacillus panaciterrae]|uniref:(2Fe-2S)-binding protein n=1 Tax=Ectobacillus panaciterrae TaxID=363872 RepID=UPI000421321E|nr:(2Fe-2S)-binding protein [Ectobacillus panaciterrae]
MITKVGLRINGENREGIVRMADTLLDTLQDQFDLTGAKRGCENGDCGSCTVLIDGWPMKSCITLTVEAAGKKITTIEGLQGSLVQKAFMDKWAFQCGYCTPGFIMNCHALVNIHPDANDKVIEEWLESNICRCTSYQEIREAVRSVLQKKGEM